MTLGQFAAVLGASPKWVQNALTVLELPLRYDEPQLWRLGLARLLDQTLGIPLKRGYVAAEKFLLDAHTLGRLHLRSLGDLVILEIDWPRVATKILISLSRVRTQYEPKKRGRPRRAPMRGVEAAVALGLDIGLLRLSLTRTSSERLRRLDEDLAFLQALKVAP